MALYVGVLGAVRLECGSVPVIAKAIDLDHEPTFRPEEIDFVPSNPRIHVWLGKVVATTDAEEHALELAARQLRLAQARWSGPAGDPARGAQPACRWAGEQSGEGPGEFAEAWLMRFLGGGS